MRGIVTILDKVPNGVRKKFIEFIAEQPNSDLIFQIITDYYLWGSENVDRLLIKSVVKNSNVFDGDKFDSTDDKLFQLWKAFEKRERQDISDKKIPTLLFGLLRQTYEYLTKSPALYDVMTDTFYLSPNTMKVMSDIVHGKFEFDSKEANSKFFEAIKLDTERRPGDNDFVARELKRLNSLLEGKERLTSLKNNKVYQKFTSEFIAMPDLGVLRKIKFDEVQRFLDNIPGCQKLSTEQFHKFCLIIEQILNPPGPVIFFDNDFYNVRFYALFELLDKDTQENLAHLIYEATSEWINKKKTSDVVLRKKVPPEADKDAPFEEYVFADQRRDEVPNEQNTPDEDKMFEALTNHFDENTPISVEEAKQIKILLMNGNYENIFHEPDTTYVYRGMNGIKQEWLQNAVGEERWAKYASKYGPGGGNKDLCIEEGDFVYAPREGGSSAWSVSETKAVEFAKLGGFDRDWFSVCLIARVAENPNAFVAGPEGLYKVKQFANNDEEKEAIGLGKLKICKIIWRLSKSVNVADVNSAVAPPAKKKKD